jgi:uncharacterized membrane protein YfcA
VFESISANSSVTSSIRIKSEEEVTFILCFILFYVFLKKDKKKDKKKKKPRGGTQQVFLFWSS